MDNLNNFETVQDVTGENLINTQSDEVKWYKTKPGIIFLSILSLIFVITFLFAVFVAYYAIRIKLGYGADLKKKFAAGDNADSEVRVDLTKYLRNDNISLGKVDAPITIVMYFDLMCPICAQANPDFNTMLGKYKDVIRVVYKNFPIESSHSGTIVLAETAMCAHEQGKFLEFSNAIYLGQKFDQESVSDIVKSLKLDEKKFKLCADENRYRDTVENDMAEISSIKLRGTPTFFVNGLRVEGAVTMEKWDQVIVNELKRLNTTQK